MTSSLFWGFVDSSCSDRTVLFCLSLSLLGSFTWRSRLPWLSHPSESAWPDRYSTRPEMNVQVSGMNPTRNDLENALHYFCGSSGPFILGLQSNNLIQDPLPCTHFWTLCTLFKALFLFPFLGYNSQLWIPDYSFMVLFMCPLCLLEAHAYLVWVGVYLQILGVNKNSISHPVELSTYKESYIGFK